MLIGISEYESGLNRLPAAVKDVEAMQRVLQDPEMGGFDEVKTLTNPDRQYMESEIEMLFSSRTKDDLLLLFFSGHGIKDDGGKLYFATRITRKTPKGDLIRSTAVSASFVHEVMSHSRARRQAIILDCCFSGAFDPALRAKDDGSVDLHSQLGSEGRVVLTSSSSTQYSFEQEGADLSIYTRYLVEGIETGAGDRNEDGHVSVLELHEYATSKVRETAPNMTPKIIVLKDKGFEIVLAKARTTDPKLKYRKAALRYIREGKIRPVSRAVLDTLRQQLGLSLEEAAEVETEVLRPYQERLANLQRYRETLIAEAEHEYPLSNSSHEDLKILQQLLGLTDEDILPIKQEVETKRKEQDKTEYENKLWRYKQEFSRAILLEYPFSEYVRNGLKNFQQSLELVQEDVDRIEEPILEQKEAEYQRQQEEQRKQREANKKEKLRQEQQRLDNFRHKYAKLQNLLIAQKWEDADKETWHLMFEAVGSRREVFASTESFREFPCDVIHEVNNLWLKYSEGYFGFSVQRQLWSKIKDNSLSGRTSKFLTKLKLPLMSLGESSQQEFSIDKCPKGYFPRRGKTMSFGNSGWVFDWQNDFWIENFHIICPRLIECGM